MRDKNYAPRVRSRATADNCRFANKLGDAALHFVCGTAALENLEVFIGPAAAKADAAVNCHNGNFITVQVKAATKKRAAGSVYLPCVCDGRDENNKPIKVGYPEHEVDFFIFWVPGYGLTYYVLPNIPTFNGRSVRAFVEEDLAGQRTDSSPYINAWHLIKEHPKMKNNGIPDAGVTIDTTPIIELPAGLIAACTTA